MGVLQQAETAYAKQVLADTEGLQEDLYKELRGRIQEADQSVPLRYAGLPCYMHTPVQDNSRWLGSSANCACCWQGGWLLLLHSHSGWAAVRCACQATRA